MKDQLTLLKQTDWDVLVILDACRFDAFKAVTGMGDPVRSPAVCTATWVSKAGRVLGARRPFYVNSNPVVDRQKDKLRGAGVRLHTLWKKHWGRFGAASIPTVHPMSVTSVAIEHAEAYHPDQMVLHYLQPHSPYIGDVPLAMARWGPGKHPMVDGCHGLKRPDVAVKKGDLTWPEVREAYISNLRLAWDAVRILVAALEGRRIVITSDHGELLGEHGGRFGHECGWTKFPELWTVPWLEIEGGSLGEAETTKRKLEALGYV